MWRISVKVGKGAGCGEQETDLRRRNIHSNKTNKREKGNWHICIHCLKWEYDYVIYCQLYLTFATVNFYLTSYFISAYMGRIWM